MMGSRRLLPAMSGLLALEAVDRLGTASAAAEELSLTQGAVSRALQALEAQLGAELLIRERKRLRITPAGRDYAAQARSSLEGLAQAALKLRSNPEGGSLSLAMLPAFGVHWLAPRLAGFSRSHPGVTVNLSTRLRPFDLRDSGFDAAIHFGRPDWPGAEHLFLMEEVVLPVCAPGLLRQPLESADDLLTYPHLQLESRPGAWRRYLAANAVSGRPPGGMMFDQFAAMTQAALHGLGLALLPLFLIREHLTDGSLIAAWNVEGRGLGCYYLVWPKDLPDRAPLTAFRTWLAGEARDIISSGSASPVG